MDRKVAKIVNGQVRKLIDLPESALSDLEKMAEEKRMKLKPYAELVLIEHSKKYKHEQK